MTDFDDIGYAPLRGDHLDSGRHHGTWHGEDERRCVDCDEPWPCPTLLASPARADKAEAELAQYRAPHARHD